MKSALGVILNRCRKSLLFAQVSERIYRPSTALAAGAKTLPAHQRLNDLPGDGVFQV
jgi:hypothetical protein